MCEIVLGISDFTNLSLYDALGNRKKSGNEYETSESLHLH